MKEIYLTDLKKESNFIQKETLDAVESVVSRADYILGEDLQLFEENFAAYCGASYCVGVANGTVALFLALMAAGIGKGDEVITSTISFAATAEAILMTGATPRFVDVDPMTLSIDINQIERVINSKTKAILPVYLYGFPVNIDALDTICKTYNLLFIADCAQAHGALYKGQKIGNREAVACFSFMPAKNLGAYGDAGCVVTNNKEMYDLIKKLRNHGRSSKYEHEIMGYAERMDNLQAAVLNVKLPYLDTWNSRRREIAKMYVSLLKDSEHVQIIAPYEDTDPCYHQFVILLENRDEVKEKMAKEGIFAGVHYPIPLHLQPAFSSLGYKKGDFSISEKAVQKVLSLPMHPFLEDAEVERVATQVLLYAK